MSEKKRVQVGVESQVVASQQDAFDFSSFQNQLQSGADSGAAKEASAKEGKEDPSSYVTSYQCRKTSIAEGLTSEALVDEHRKSIATLSVRELGKAVDVTDLTGITLSKRHTISQVEYEADLDAAAYSSMGGYSFGMTADQADAAERKPKPQ